MSRSNPFKQKPRSVRHTTLLVVEGDNEKVFLKHIKLGCGRNCGTRSTIINMHGGSGDYILKKAIQLGKDYNNILCLYDADRAPKCKKSIRKAERLGIIRIESQPCLEGFLLEILRKPIPHASGDCKSALRQITGGDSLNEATTLSKHFPKELLEQRREAIPILDQLFKTIQPGIEKA